MQFYAPFWNSRMLSIYFAHHYNLPSLSHLEAHNGDEREREGYFADGHLHLCLTVKPLSCVNMRKY